MTFDQLTFRYSSSMAEKQTNQIRNRFKSGKFSNDVMFIYNLLPTTQVSTV